MGYAIMVNGPGAAHRVKTILNKQPTAFYRDRHRDDSVYKIKAPIVYFDRAEGETAGYVNWSRMHTFPVNENLQRTDFFYIPPVFYGYSTGASVKSGSYDVAWKYAYYQATVPKKKEGTDETSTVELDGTVVTSEYPILKPNSFILNSEPKEHMASAKLQELSGMSDKTDIAHSCIGVFEIEDPNYVANTEQFWIDKRFVQDMRSKTIRHPYFIPSESQSLAWTPQIPIEDLYGCRWKLTSAYGAFKDEKFGANGLGAFWDSEAGAYDDALHYVTTSQDNVLGINWAPSYIEKMFRDKSFDGRKPREYCLDYAPKIKCVKFFWLAVTPAMQANIKRINGAVEEGAVPMKYCVNYNPSTEIVCTGSNQANYPSYFMSKPSLYSNFPQPPGLEGVAQEEGSATTCTTRPGLWAYNHSDKNRCYPTFYTNSCYSTLPNITWTNSHQEVESFTSNETNNPGASAACSQMYFESTDSVYKMFTDEKLQLIAAYPVIISWKSSTSDSEEWYASYVWNNQRFPELGGTIDFGVNYHESTNIDKQIRILCCGFVASREDNYDITVEGTASNAETPGNGNGNGSVPRPESPKPAKPLPVIKSLSLGDTVYGWSQVQSNPDDNPETTYEYEFTRIGTMADIYRKALRQNSANPAYKQTKPSIKYDYRYCPHTKPDAPKNGSALPAGYGRPTLIPNGGAIKLSERRKQEDILIPVTEVKIPLYEIYSMDSAAEGRIPYVSNVECNESGELVVTTKYLQLYVTGYKTATVFDNGKYYDEEEEKWVEKEWYESDYPIISDLTFQEFHTAEELNEESGRWVEHEQEMCMPLVMSGTAHVTMPLSFFKEEEGKTQPHYDPYNLVNVNKQLPVWSKYGAEAYNYCKEKTAEHLKKMDADYEEYLAREQEGSNG